MPEEVEVEEYNQNILRDLLPIYYQRLFPHIPFYKWLSYGLSEDGIFTNREFSFTLADDVYIRYLSYSSQKELEADVRARNPFKIDIGAVMTIRPRDHRTGKAQPIQRELIFDIDMTDYDEVRTCCSGAEVCQKCWKFMVVACQILDIALREDFGFEHILWVFSGRRGIHCWVCDKAARHLSNKNRNAVAEYLNLFNGQRVNVVGDRMHHSMKRAYRIIENHFEDICINDQNLFGTPKGLQKLFELIPDEGIRKDLEGQMAGVDVSKSRTVWDLVKRFVQANQHLKTMQRKMKFLLEEIQMSLLCPRLDINVSKGANHLLKAPFCVHPKTGKICVPLNPSAVAKFNPKTVPTIKQLLKEIDVFDVTTADPNEKSKIADYKKTSMNKDLFVFNEFVRKLESSLKTAKVAASDAKMEF